MTIINDHPSYNSGMFTPPFSAQTDTTSMGAVFRQSTLSPATSTQLGEWLEVSC
jgi:hypothetical protein